MAPRGRTPVPGLTAAEFTARFQEGVRVFWTLAAGLLGDPAEAEDVCQEAFLGAYGKRSQFEPGTSFNAWMARFIRYGVANELRKRSRRQTAATDPFVLDQGHSLPESSASGAGDPLSTTLFAEDEFDDRILAGLRKLGEVPRSCLLLRSLRELSFAEIAELLEIPEGTAMSHVHRARAALRARLDPTLDGVRP